MLAAIETVTNADPIRESRRDNSDAAAKAAACETFHGFISSWGDVNALAPDRGWRNFARSALIKRRLLCGETMRSGRFKYPNTRHRRDTKGLRQFLTPEQQRAWLEGEVSPRDMEERSESLEQRFKYAARFEKLLRLPQAQDVLDILRLYGEECLPIPRTTERLYWSVSCLPSTSDKPLVRVNASWMELFTLLPDGEGLRARFILHLSNFTIDGSPEPDHLDQSLIEQCVLGPEDVTHFLWKADTFGLKVRGSDSIRKFLAVPRALRAIRNFNLTHMNRGRNAYQASHCYSVADHMLGD